MRQTGYTLIEILTAMTIVGVLAVFSVPAILSTTTKTQNNSVGKTETIVQSFVAMVKNYEATGLDFNPNTTSPAPMAISFLYGRYGSYLNLQQGGGGTTYYLLPDGSRLTDNVVLFSQATAGYATNAATQWNGIDGSPCGDSNLGECFYYDYNGVKPPNAIGKTGDIIPLHFDPVTGSVKSLYAFEAELQAPNPPDCKYVSSYDVYTNTAGAAACP